jgi:hypothetical protein
MRALRAALLVLVCGSALPVVAQNTLANRTYDPKTNTKIAITALHSSLPSSGYMPVRVNLRNGTKLDRTWSFRFKSSDLGYSNEGNSVRSQFSAGCAAGQSLTFDFLVPLVTAFQEDYSPSTDLEVTASAPALPSVSGSMDTVYDPNWPAVILSDTLFRRNASNLDSEAQKHMSGSSHGGRSGSIQFGGQFDPKQMSDDWRAYTGYDACLLTDDDWRELNPGARSAILQWNRMGGSLVIYSTSPSTDCQSLGIEGEKPGTRDTTRSWGAAHIRSIPSSNVLPGKPTVDLVANTLYSETKRRRLDSLRSDFQPNWPLHLAFGKKTAHILLFILVLIAFGILVGPVNLFVFAKSGQRHRLFVTTPIISIGASLLLIVLILFQDGFGGRGHRLLLVEVRPDNTENAAYLSQEQIARTGVLLGTSFTTSEPAFLTPVLIEESRWARVTSTNDGGNGRYTVDVEQDGLKVAGDWFQSRSEHGHLLEGVRPTRGRIELIAAGPDPVVTSTFEFPLETLYFLDKDGSPWMATEVQQGRNTKLTAISAGQFKAWVDSQKKLFASQNQKRLNLTAHRLGHFVATSTELPAIETLGAINWRKTDAVLTGPVLNAGMAGATPPTAERDTQ